MKVNPSLGYAGSRIVLVTTVGALLFLACGFEVTAALTSREGVELVYRLEGATASQADEAFDVILKRFQQFGPVQGRQVIVRRLRPQEFSVELPALEGSDLERVKKLIETMGDLQFMIVADKQDKEKIKAILGRKEEGSYDPGKEEFDVALQEAGDGSPLPEGDPTSYVLIERKGSVDGDTLARVYATVDSLMNPAIGFDLNDEGAKRFSELTEKNKGRQLGIILDGVVKSSPAIEERIAGRGIIQGAFSQDEVNNFVVVLGLKKLPAKPVLLKEKPGGPDTEDESDRGKKRGTGK